VRGDPVGQRLFFRGNTGTDLPIRQRRRILMQAHLDYWDDHEVLQTVEGAWDRTLPPLTVKRERPATAPIRHELLMTRLHGIGQLLLVVCALTGFVLGVVNSITIVQQRRAEAAAFFARVARDGRETQARVTHSTTTWGYGKDLSFPVQVYA